VIRSYFNAEAEEVNKKVAVNGYGEPQLKTILRNISCRKMEKTQLIRSAKGDEVISSLEVWFPPEVERLPPQSELVFDGKKSTVIKSSYLPGIKDNICLQVFLK